VDWEYKERTDWCVEQLRQHNAGIIIADQGWLSHYLIQTNRCVDLHHASWLSIMPVRFQLWFADPVFAHQTALAMTHLMQMPAYAWIEEVAFSKGKACPPPEPGSERIDLADMRGLFCIWGGLSAIAVLMALANRVALELAKRRRKGDDGEANSTAQDGVAIGIDGLPGPHPELDQFATDGQMLRYLVSRIDNMNFNQAEMKVQQAEMKQDIKENLWKKGLEKLRLSSGEGGLESPRESPRESPQDGVKA